MREYQCNTRQHQCNVRLRQLDVRQHQLNIDAVNFFPINCLGREGYKTSD